MDDNADNDPSWGVWFNGPDHDILTQFLQIVLNPGAPMVSGQMSIIP